MINSNKKGQVNVFIIIGIVIVIVGALIFIFRDDIQINRISTTQLEPINEYIKTCLEDKLKEEIRNRTKFGGLNELSHADTVFTKFNVLNTPRNALPSLPEIAANIGNDIEIFLKDGGCSLDVFRDNFVIQENKENINADVEIAENLVNLDLTYQITASKDDFEAEINEFSIALESNLFSMWEGANNVINGVNAGMNLNINDYCQDLEVKCFSPENRNGARFIVIGEEEDFPDNGEYSEEGDVFIFVIR